MASATPIVLTGAAGFIGFHLAHRLLAAGHRVVGVDVVNDYYPVVVKQRRLALLREQPGFSFAALDLADAEAFADLVARERPSRVCHLAAQAGVRYSLTHPRVYTASNIEGTLNVLEACRHHGVERLVYASSSSVYGGNTKVPFSEGDPVNTPISLYAATKRANELMAHTYTHLFGLQTVGLRFFTVYGRWGRPDMALWIFAEKILAGEAIPVFNQGQLKRDFTHVSDIVAGLDACLFAEGLAPYEVLNLGNHQSEELMTLIDLLEQALGRPALRNLLPMQPGDVPATYADIAQAQTKLGFHPRTPLAVGVPDFVEWYRSEPEIAAAVAAWRAAGGGG
ncbi:MAG: NAD-dependent epimerase/dehydratase family protein [Fimbriimonadaceae bacterium]|nr:NAD-dependent epimerase/dehydratase family protein [Fimbriimonadaceae bacterium]